MREWLGMYGELDQRGNNAADFPDPEGGGNYDNTFIT
jgi:hypothetical protein